jgi:sugar lactone lactonase YvrE
VVYDAAGTFVHQWDVTSGSLPSLRMPSGIAIDAQGAVYVTDLKRDRPHKLQAPDRTGPPFPSLRPAWAQGVGEATLNH